jgi:uncharacterized protein with HEPN domain
MSKGRRELDFLQAIEDAIERILDYTADFTGERYLRDYKTQDAVVRNLEVIGEATKNLSDEFRAKYPKLPWQEMVGTRDRLMHHYFGINHEIVWQIVEEGLTDLKKQIEQLINEFPES